MGIFLLRLRERRSRGVFGFFLLYTTSILATRFTFKKHPMPFIITPPTMQTLRTNGLKLFLSLAWLWIEIRAWLAFNAAAQLVRADAGYMPIRWIASLAIFSALELCTSLLPSP